MFLTYNEKKSVDDIIAGDGAELPTLPAIGAENLLIKAENLTALRSLLANGYENSVDLVYIDPPFATGNVFRAGESRTSTISSSLKDEVAYVDDKAGAEFIEFLRERLILLHRMMTDRGSIYLHIDYKIGHYVKVVMDEVFGIKNFRNDITRVKCNPKNFKRRGYGNVKDLILFYTKSDNFIWNEPMVDRADAEIDRLFKKVDANGRRYTTTPLHAPGETIGGATGSTWRGQHPPKGRHWRHAPHVLEELDRSGLIEWSRTGVPRKIIYAAESQKKRLQDIWEFKDTQEPDYPTQKNRDLLDLVIRTSSDSSSRILDCFCGSGTTLVAASMLGRSWIGIDSSDAAIRISKKRLQESGLLGQHSFIDAIFASKPAKMS